MTGRVERENTGRMHPGQDLVIAGYAGFAGTCEIIRQKWDRLTHHFAVGYLEEALIGGPTPAPGLWESLGAADWEPAGAGGVMTALWNLSGGYRMGLECSLRRIPVRQETIEVCEFFGINPYRLLSFGCFVLAADSGSQLAAALKERQIPAQVVGRVTGGITRAITGGETLSYLERPQPDEIYKIPGIKLRLENQEAWL